MALWSAFLIASSSSAADWPQWRGPGRDARIDAPAWPTSLQGEHLTQTWRVDHGPSYSGPIIVGDRVFTTETRDKKVEVVFAHDSATGRELWQASWPGSMAVPFFAASNGSWIRATPACDGERLYVGGMRDLLVCLDASTGKELWRFDFVEKFGTPLPAFGFVASPLLDGDSVIVQAGSAVVRLDRRSGDVRWKALEERDAMMGSAFSSPTIATVAGRRQLLVQARQKLAGLDAETGRVLWSQAIPAERGMNIQTPTLAGERSLFVSAPGAKSYRFDLAAEGDGFGVREAWTNKLQTYMSSPVVIGDHAYCHLKNQRVACFDLASGKEAWMTEQRFGKYWSMVANADRVLALDEKGTLYLFRATSEKFDLLDSRSVSDGEAWAHLAVVDQDIFIRDIKGLAAWRWR